MIKLAICDDKEEHLDRLKKDVEKSCKKNIIIDCFSNAKKLQKLNNESNLQYDIILLDIELGEINGIKLAKELLNQNPHLQIIFVSSYKHYFEQVYYVSHVSFVSKPVKQKYLINALNKSIKTIEEYKAIPKLAIKQNSKIYTLIQNSIIYIERQKRNTQIHTTNENIQCSQKLSEIFKNLDDKLFFRCHESFIINLNFIKEYKLNCIITFDDTIIPVSRKYQKSLKEKFNFYILSI